MVIDLAANPKQETFFNTAVEAAFGLNDYRYLAYGGAIRGGKTFVCLTTLTQLCKWFPNSKWHIIRAVFPNLEKTTIPSLEKILAGAKNWQWRRSKSNYYVEYVPNGSKIFFMSENITDDPNLDNFLGLETNGVMLEQVEELSEKLLNITISRAGSWYIPKMPKPLILMTFNPTQTWVKQRIYEKHVKGELNAPWYYQNATPKDNAFVTDEQWQGWEQMAERYQKQFIEGDWTDFNNENNRWAFAYDREKHTKDNEKHMGHIIYLSFDFNVNPMCCSVIQHYNKTIKVIETVKLQDADTVKMCQYIKVHYPNALFMVTGDASGAARNASQQDNMNNYRLIRAQLGLNDNQLQVPSNNPTLESNKVLVNSILANYKVEIHSEKAKGLHFDLSNARIHPDGSIIKDNRKDPTQQLDSLDTLRYWCNTFMPDFLDNPLKYK